MSHERSHVVRSFLVLLTLSFAGTCAHGRDYWVARYGSDTNACTNKTSDACLSLQKGVSVLAPGDTLNIGSGVYSEDGGRSPYNTSKTSGWTSTTGQGDIVSAAVVMDRSGTASLPIIIQGDPSNQAPAIIDCGHVYQGKATYLAGIFTNRQDYIQFKNFTIRNCMSKGIYDWDRGDDSVDVPDSNEVSVGVLIDGLTIHHIGGSDNDAGIAMWTTKDWIVRNTHIYDIYGWPPAGRVGTGIHSYGTVNALIEHNFIESGSGGSGIYWKDHYVANASTRAPVFESEIRYNMIDVNGLGVCVCVQPDNEAGENYIHHNIIRSGGTENNGIRVAMAGASYVTTAPQRIEHNLIIGRDAIDSSGLNFSGTTDVRLRGNIVHNFSAGLVVQNVTAARPAVLTASDYNIWGASDVPMLAMLGRYSTVLAKNYSNLPSWQAAVVSDTPVLGFSHPDTHSAQAGIASVIRDFRNGDYRLMPTSPASNLMPDGSNAGPYQYGSEVIGPMLGSATIPPKAPSLNVQ